MHPLEPDIIVSAHFYSEDEGGRKTATPPDRFGCIFTFDGENFDCFLLLENIGAVKPGDLVQVPIKFLHPQLVKSRLRIGSSFILRELRTIAEGQVREILP
jgi:hypothetical protein